MSARAGIACVGNACVGNACVGNPRGVDRGLGRADGERGSVTAELAVGLPAVVLVLVLVLGVAAAGMTQMRCADGARAAARAAALGADPADDGRRVAGDGARVVVARDGPWVSVTVSADVAGLPGPLRASATSVARVEP